MDLFCYAFKNNKGELESPFLEYLEKYAIEKTDSEEKKRKKVKKIMNIKAHLEYLFTNNGKYDLPPIVQKYKNREIGILKIKESDKLIRIAFFTKIDKQIIFLNAFDKPKLYEKGKKQKVDKMIEKILDQVENFKLNFLKDIVYIPLNI